MSCLFCVSSFLTSSEWQKVEKVIKVGRGMKKVLYLLAFCVVCPRVCDIGENMGGLQMKLTKETQL
jgi:hypothetical protein